MSIPPSERPRFVRALFTRIARRYDLMNRLMTGYQDQRWRREVIQRAGLHPGDRLLDLGAGTGDLAYEALRQQPQVKVIAADFTLEMMRIGRRNGSGPHWTAADALQLPFPDSTFQAVVSGFLMRNVSDPQRCLQEQYRVLQPGGRIVILDTTRPLCNLLSPFIWIHMHILIPLLGRLLTGDPDAYHYLSDSTEQFFTAEHLADLMAAAGFQRIGFRRLMFGTIAIHWAEKSPRRKLG